MAHSVSSRLLIPFLLLAALVNALPTNAQTPAPTPVDPAEANSGNDLPPLRIGRATLTGSFQGDYTKVNGDPQDLYRDEFAIKRARVGIAGPLTTRVGWNISAELTATPVLRNAFVQVKLARGVNVRVGQSTPLSSIERATSPTAIELIDRSRITRELTHTQDVGVMIFNVAPIARTLSYSLSVVNGSGFNRGDNNDAKDVVGRIELRLPAVRALSLVASGANGRQPNGVRRRSSLGAQYDGRTVKALLEGLREHTTGYDVRRGYVAMAVYRFRPERVMPHFRMAEAVARFISFEDPLSAQGLPSATPDEDAATAASHLAFVPVTTRELQTGGNYYVNGNVRFMLNVVVPVDSRRTPGTSVIARTQILF